MPDEADPYRGDDVYWNHTAAAGLLFASYRGFCEDEGREPVRPGFFVELVVAMEAGAGVQSSPTIGSGRRCRATGRPTNGSPPSTHPRCTATARNSAEGTAGDRWKSGRSRPSSPPSYRRICPMTPITLRSTSRPWRSAGPGSRAISPVGRLRGRRAPTPGTDPSEARSDGDLRCRRTADTGFA